MPLCEHHLSYLPRLQFDESDVFAFLQQNLCGRTYLDKAKGRGVVIAHCGEQLAVEYDDKSVQITTVEEMLRNRDKTVRYVTSSAQAGANGPDLSETINSIVKMFSIAPGNRVSHSRFGDGTVTGCDGDFIYVRFDTEKDEKKFDLKMALEKGFIRLTT